MNIETQMGFYKTTIPLVTEQISGNWQVSLVVEKLVTGNRQLIPGTTPW